MPGLTRLARQRAILLIGLRAFLARRLALPYSIGRGLPSAVSNTIHFPGGSGRTKQRTGSTSRTVGRQGTPRRHGRATGRSEYRLP